ncbi:MAG: hypothetical protein ACE5G0_23135 [Rhodothermales bacterium]
MGNLDGTRTEYFDIDPSEDNVLSLSNELFENYWDQIIFGPCLQGAVFEIQFFEKPRIGYLDGYLTIGRQGPRAWHFHLCIGPHRGSESQPVPAELAAWRRCARAAFFRDFDPAGRCGSWGFRMWNGRGEQMITLWFPNPWLDPEKLHYVKTPDWTRMDLWMRLRERYAGIPTEPPPEKSEPPMMH